MRSKDLPKEPVLIKCFHCGNKTPMKSVGQYSWGSKDLDLRERDIDFNYLYELFACPVCHHVTLRQLYTDEFMYHPMAYDYYEEREETILYPISSIECVAVPPNIKNAYEAALKVKSIDKNLCLIGLRRTLEMILKDKGAEKWGLKDKIEEIASKGILPDSLKEASSFAKVLGDTAAHDKDLEIDMNDVDSVSDFIRYIIEYLYVVPYKINSYKEIFDKKSSN